MQMVAPIICNKLETRQNVSDNYLNLFLCFVSYRQPGNDQHFFDSAISMCKSAYTRFSTRYSFDLPLFIFGYSKLRIVGASIHLCFCFFDRTRAVYIVFVPNLSQKDVYDISTVICTWLEQKGGKKSYSFGSFPRNGL
jgi:hypothetical protein